MKYSAKYVGYLRVTKRPCVTFKDTYDNVTFFKTPCLWICLVQ